MSLTLPQLTESREPKYRQLVRLIAEQIRSGALQPGERLPSDRRLAHLLDLSPTTTTAAMEELVRQKFAVRRPGAGTFVTDEPNGLNRQLRIGFFTPQNAPSSTYIRKIFYTLWGYFAENHCDLLPLTRNFEELPETFREYRFDGVLIFNRGDIALEKLREWRAGGLPLLLLSSIWDEASDISIGYSNRALVDEAVRYLAALGHRRIGFVTENPLSRPNDLRINGFMKSMYQLGLPLDPTWMLTNNPSDEELLDFLKAPERPSSIILGNCTILPRFSEVLSRSGLRIPDDLSILCLDEHENAKNYLPALSLFRIDVVGFSQRAAERLLREIRNETIPVENECPPNYEFVEAGSCKKFTEGE